MTDNDLNIDNISFLLESSDYKDKTNDEVRTNSKYLPSKDEFNFLIAKLRVIATWGNSRSNFRIHPNSNEGKT